jgi:hypothetical protein
MSRLRGSNALPFQLGHASNRRKERESNPQGPSEPTRFRDGIPRLWQSFRDLSRLWRVAERAGPEGIVLGAQPRRARCAQRREAAPEPDSAGREAAPAGGARRKERESNPQGL